MYRYCIWTIILLNHGIKIFIDGLCTTEPGSDSDYKKMVCRDCDEKELPDADKNYVYEVLVLDIRGCKNMVLSKEKLLNEFPSIKEFHANDISPELRKNLSTKDTFNYLTELTVMSFTNSQLTDEDLWDLPHELLKYNVDGNLYTNLDLRLCPKLIEFSGNKNQFIKTPIFSDPSFVEKVYLKGNPLVNMHVFDLASLCLLTTFEAELQMNAFANTNEGACQCEEVKEWARRFNISGLKVTCPKAKGQNDCNFDFGEELVIYENCKKYTNPITESDSPKTYETRDLIVAGIFIAVCIAVPVILAAILYNITDED